MDPSARFADNLRRLRIERGLSQGELAGMSKLHQTEIARLEAGARSPRLETMVKLAVGLQVTVAALVEGIPRN
jgi:transcriptional regulator with XRE-family HTH domain